MLRISELMEISAVRDHNIQIETSLQHNFMYILLSIMAYKANDKMKK